MLQPWGRHTVQLTGDPCVFACCRGGNKPVAQPRDGCKMGWGGGDDK